MERWYVVFTKSREEAIADEHLQRQHFQTCLPLFKELRRRRRKWEEVIEPLFPRYLFIKLTLEKDSVAPIRSTRGVIGLVRFGLEPAPLPVHFVEELNQCIDPNLGYHISRRPLFKTGDFIKILEGPFAECTGIYQKDVGSKRALLLLDFLGRCNSVAFHYDQLSPGYPCEGA